MRRLLLILLLAPVGVSMVGCAPSATEAREMEITAYCPCGECCGWERRSSLFFLPGYYRKVISAGPHQGRPYTGLTASGARPRAFRPGILSSDSLARFWMIPFRLALFPWMLSSREGTIAADTRYYPFGTRMFIPDYGWGVVQDRGGAIQGPNRLDIFFDSHQEALRWGRQWQTVLIFPAD